MKLVRLILPIASLAFSTHTLSGEPTEDAYRKIHEALFAAFLPVDEIEDDPKLNTLFQMARDGIWTAGSASAQFHQLLLPFADLRPFSVVCGLPATATEAGAFTAAGAAERSRVLFLLQSCPANDARRLAMNVRNFYVVRTYGAIQEALTGVKIDLYAPPGFVEQHRPRLPPSRLIYDPTKRAIGFKDGEIDYLVVGSGPAGSVLAHELRRGGKRVLLVERGSLIVPGSMETRLVDDLIDTRTSVDGAIRIRNGMAVGGGSQVNVDLCFAPNSPSVRARIESWRREGRIGKSDFTAGQLATAYEWVKRTIGTRALSESEINPNNRALWDGAKLDGLHPKLYDLNTYPPGQSPYPLTDKRSAETQLVMEALTDARNPLSLLPDADVRRVLFEAQGGSKRAVGVEVKTRNAIEDAGVMADPNGLGLKAGEILTIRAKKVILSAGALGSPAILLRSGLENAEIGRGVILHPSMPIMGRFDRTIDALKGTQASVFVDDRLISEGYALESMSDQPLYAALMSPGPPMHTFDMVRAYRNLAGFGVMLIDTPSRENAVILDRDGEPQVTYTLSGADKERFRRGVAEAVRIMFLAGAKEVYLPTTEDILGNGDVAKELKPVILTDIRQAEVVAKNLAFVPNRTIVTSAHMQATNKMGVSARDSVVSKDFRVWGTSGLYVVDGSVFPTSIGANPMQSIYTFAKIFADRMAPAHKRLHANP